MSENMFKYVKKLSEEKASDLLANYNPDKLNTLKTILTKCKDTLSTVKNRYDFSFLEAQFNTDFADLSDKLDLTVNVFIFEEIDHDTINSIIKPVAGTKDKPVAEKINAIIAVHIQYT